ncbi:MAG TPA: peptidyl-prolyl cis-trans isomerase [Verrucomicrobiae bacterium]|nr:peptidyl-prolyl cis-trans isomerase [Verrucomicrobiae bacterium]
MKPWSISLAVGLCFVCGNAARAELANAIQAIVNDAVITYHEVESLNQQTAPLVVTKYSNSRSLLESKIAEMQHENLDTLVEQQLILREFKTAGYSLPESVLDDLVQESIKSDFGDRATLTKTLEARGMSYEKFRQQVKDRFIVAQLRLKNISQEIIISPHKIEKYYLDHRDDFKEEDRIKLRRITLNKSADPNAPDARKLAGEIRDRLKQGVSFAEIATELADMNPQNSKAGTEGVWYDRSALRRELAEAAFALKAGQCSDIIETTGECYLLMVDEVSTAHYKSLNEVRDEIERRLRSEERNRLEKQWIDKLKKKTFIQYFF